MEAAVACGDATLLGLAAVGIEVTYRELKSTFGLGEKQCWHPQAAVRSVQWSAWVYVVLVLAGYRAWGLSRGARPPTRWWRGSG